MNKKYFFILLVLPLCSGSSYVVKDGNKEVGSLVTHDGSSEKEVISKQELKEASTGYTQAEASHAKAVKVEPIKNSLEVPLQPVRGDYGIVKGISEREVERIASSENMGFPDKTTEYAPGDTYPVNTWNYKYEAGGFEHSFKVHFDSDGKVIRANHQTAKK